MLIAKMSSIINAEKDFIVLCLYKLYLNQLVVKVDKNIFDQAFLKFSGVNLFISFTNRLNPCFIIVKYWVTSAQQQ